MLMPVGPVPPPTIFVGAGEAIERKGRPDGFDPFSYANSTVDTYARTRRRWLCCWRDRLCPFDQLPGAR